jgi:hypothetical protein
MGRASLAEDGTLNGARIRPFLRPHPWPHPWPERALRQPAAPRPAPLAGRVPAAWQEAA